MVNAYSKSIRFLFGLEIFGMKFGLQGIQMLLKSIGDPHRNFRSIHVAGTNGKGSTSSMLAAVFTAAGYKTGLYTSPHLVSFTERIRINGKPIPHREVVRLTNLVKRQVKKQQATYFETVTAIAFKYFCDSNVDIAIVETGLGGRLDATNVLRPIVSVITNVSLEHTEILGKTLEKIVNEKAGIIKHSIPCVTGVSQTRAFQVLRRKANEQNASLLRSRQVRVNILKSSLEGLVVSAAFKSVKVHNLKVSLAGKHQAINVQTVLRTLFVVRAQGIYHIHDRHIRSGLMNIESLAGLRARLSVLHRHPLVLGDVAHNPDSIQRLVESLQGLKISDVLVVFGVVRDKDYKTMIRFLKPIAGAAILTMAQTKRARMIADLFSEFSRQGIEVVGTYPTVWKALTSALALARTNGPILVTGSHYILGEALSFLRSRKFT